jgi:hypothetical protein
MAAITPTSADLLAQSLSKNFQTDKKCRAAILSLAHRKGEDKAVARDDKPDHERSCRGPCSE